MRARTNRLKPRSRVTVVTSSIDRRPTPSDGRTAKRWWRSERASPFASAVGPGWGGAIEVRRGPAPEPVCRTPAPLSTQPARRPTTDSSATVPGARWSGWSGAAGQLPPDRVALHQARVGGRPEQTGPGTVVGHRREPAQGPAGPDLHLVAPAAQLGHHAVPEPLLHHQ